MNEIQNNHGLGEQWKRNLVGLRFAADKQQIIIKNMQKRDASSEEKCDVTVNPNDVGCVSILKRFIPGDKMDGKWWGESGTRQFSDHVDYSDLLTEGAKQCGEGLAVESIDLLRSKAFSDEEHSKTPHTKVLMTHMPDGFSVMLITIGTTRTDHVGRHPPIYMSITVPTECSRDFFEQLQAHPAPMLLRIAKELDPHLPEQLGLPSKFTFLSSFIDLSGKGTGDGVELGRAALRGKISRNLDS
ncbi:MAG: hypothetical protein WCX61_00040 [Candidatus Peribacteraceae bacterium]|jgi:hypothetical protein